MNVSEIEIIILFGDLVVLVGGTESTVTPTVWPCTGPLIQCQVSEISVSWFWKFYETGF